MQTSQQVVKINHQKRRFDDYDMATSQRSSKRSRKSAKRYN